jgi:nucleotide-binding universal stress UspA family protein
MHPLNYDVGNPASRIIFVGLTKECPLLWVIEQHRIRTRHHGVSVQPAATAHLDLHQANPKHCAYDGTFPNLPRNLTMYKRILVTTDGSDLSSKAVDAALGLAQANGAEVFALKVVPVYPQSYFEGAIALETSEVQRVEQQWSDAAQSVVQAVVQAGANKGVRVHALIRKNEVVADTILATAKEQQCDLIVMASHGRRGLQKLLLGSETQHVLTHATLPVLVVK